MSYNVTTWSNTGFDLNNIPDNPSLLGQGVSFPAVEIMQNRYLNSIRISATWEQVKDIDYVAVGNDYYYVSNVTMLATDVAELTLMQDYINSVGGVTQVNFLDGVTERAHLTDDTLAAKNDELMLPCEPLELKVEKYNPTEGSDTLVAIESVCDIPATYRRRGNYAYTNTNDDEVFVPAIQGLGNSSVTSYAYPTGQKSKRGTCMDILSIEGNGVTGYDVDAGHNVIMTPYDYIKQAVANIHGLGQAESVVNAIEYPETLVSFKCGQFLDDQGKGDGVRIDGSTKKAFKRIVEISGKVMTSPLNTLPFNYISNLNNNIINHSDFCPYGLLTASGEKAEFTPYELMEGNNYTEPAIRMMSDPNPDGKPYYRFSMVNGNVSLDGFFLNAIGGLNWKQYPLVFNGKSGSILDAIQANSNYDVMNRSYAVDRFDLLMSSLGNINENMWKSIGGVLNEDGSAVGEGIGNMIGTPLQAAGKRGRMDYEFQSTKNQIQTNFKIAQAASPILKFPYGSEPLRMQLGNGCICYRYIYTQRDARRIDKLLNMYGLKTTQPLTRTLLTNKPKFNYIKASGVKCIGHSRYLDDGIAEQLEGGVRIWHVTPNPNLYEGAQ